MRRLRADLWQTSPYRPAPDFVTHAYLWTPPNGSNVLFHAPGDGSDLDEIAALGGVAHQYLTHRDEAGPALGLVAGRFGSRLHAPVIESEEIGRFAAADVWFAEHHVDDQDIEVIPTPGHSPGSTSFAVAGYLFVGDTVFRSRDGDWTAGYIPGISDAAALRASLDVLGTYTPDLVLSAVGAHSLDDRPWEHCTREAATMLPATAR